MATEDFALAADLERTYISGIERGKRNVSLRNLDVLAKTLGVSLAQMMEEL